jgi:hypothetical protein
VRLLSLAGVGGVVFAGGAGVEAVFVGLGGWRFDFATFFEGGGEL